jgi:hypothetical protein
VLPRHSAIVGRYLIALLLVLNRQNGYYPLETNRVAGLAQTACEQYRLSRSCRTRPQPGRLAQGARDLKGKDAVNYPTWDAAGEALKQIKSVNTDESRTIARAH